MWASVAPKLSDNETKAPVTKHTAEIIVRVRPFVNHADFYEDKCLQHLKCNLIHNSQKTHREILKNCK